MSIVSNAIESALTLALRNEIQYFRDAMDISTKNKINLETFDPLNYQACLLGQTGMQDGNYREGIGMIPFEYRLGRFGGSGMTPFEIWSAYQWEKGNQEYVLKVLRCMKGESNDCPEVWFKED